ncbi:MAG: 2-hydroxychromene-2-carboxylate isomerase [Pseudomonadales bacterium]
MSEGASDLPKRIDFYWDLGSTNTYFALKLIQPIAAKYKAAVHWHPFNLGYVFRSNNYELMQEPKAKLNNRLDDLHRWAKKYQLPFKRPTNFPMKTARALRGALAMRSWDLELPYIEAIFAEYWEQDNGAIGDYSELRKVAARLGVDADEFERLSESDEVRQALISSTDSARARGVFGAPSIIIGNELYWGKDRMEFVEDQLAGLS